MAVVPKTLILRSPGTNCDQETAFAFELAGATTQSIHINQLLRNPKRIADFQILCIPGGFSYGDDVAAGRVLASQLQNHLSDVLNEFHGSGKLILGICNGFQVLVKSGLLFADAGGGSPSSPVPGIEDLRSEISGLRSEISGLRSEISGLRSEIGTHEPNAGASGGPAATLTWNASGRYMDTWVNLRVDDRLCVFLANIDRIELPIAHAEGRFISCNERVLDRLEAKHQLAMRYCRADGAETYNPNGSQRDVAGVCNDTGRIFGLMPHPERNIDPTHHPSWTRRPLTDAGPGLAIFQNAVRYFR